MPPRSFYDVTGLTQAGALVPEVVIVHLLNISDWSLR